MVGLMDVRGFDVEDDALMTRFHQIIGAADQFERPSSPMWSLEETKVQFRTGVTGERWDAFAAFDGDSMVGAGFAILTLLDNTDKLYAGFFVEPALRRRGIGTALVGHAVELAKQEGRTTILAGSGLPYDERETHPYSRFAKKNGFTMGYAEVHRQLDLPLPVERIRAMQAECAPRHQGYEIRTFHDEIPDELVESYCYLENQLALDAPTGDVDFEAESMTPEIYREKAARRREQGRHTLTTLAVTPEGEAVANTALVIPPADMPKVYQFSTLVRRDHRGHRLGAAVKLQNLLALQERYPERTEIHTTNNETNDTMIGINERLGFRALEICPEFQLKI